MPAELSTLRLLPAIYALTLFVSALLLFLIQPMFTKMVLPRLGGAPTVWSIAMVFFQAALLAGYSYAHVLVRRLSPWQGAFVHFCLLACAAATLPIAISSLFAVPPTEGVSIWLIGLFSASIGLPFVALSASAPLLQGWFAGLDHAQARNPYVLYAASNLGSFAALFAYPVVVEPFLTLREQSQIWSTGFAVLAVLIAVAAVLGQRHQSEALAPERAVTTASTPWPERLRWMALAAIPVGLTISVTTYISTDVASAPFLWVIPLALYLLTFVAVFRERPWLPASVVVMLVPFVVAPLSIGLLGGAKHYMFAMVALNLAAFVLLTLLCHAELYRRRPAPAKLTEFYLWMSVGGVAGGLFAALAAPHLFPLTYEYPLLIVVALMAMPGMFVPRGRRLAREIVPPLALAGVAVVARLVFGVELPASAALPFQIALVALAAVMLFQRNRPTRFAALAVLAFLVTALWQPGLNRVLTLRSFFGVHQVIDTADGYRLLFNGTTLHGAERIADIASSTPEPLTYYSPDGAIGQGIEAARSAQGGLRRVAVVGLGTGSLSCLRRGGERWTFYEIDPAVVQIARNPKLFNFMSSCAPAAPIVLGDARLTLAQSPETYDLIVLDAFSSDAIPVHLLTREAIAGYLSRLAPHGALVLHISNRYLELASVVAAIAASEGLVAKGKLDARAPTIPWDYRANAQAAVLARSPDTLRNLESVAGWTTLPLETTVAAWTDDYSNIFGALLRKQLR
ncbi:MAG TPA: fused MFS/spermidine synthase [Pseudolabrys sp.]|nr:fused MFS/spermidine synthase [Pseudolabrys sp.]